MITPPGKDRSGQNGSGEVSPHPPFVAGVHLGDHAEDGEKRQHDPGQHAADEREPFIHGPPSG
jgi:hypothetical protein